MSVFYDLASLVLVPSGYKAEKVYAQKPLTTDGQLTFSRASTATRVNTSGLIETVASNVPRLDYTNSSCPKLLLEPSRTNAALYSSDFDQWSDGLGCDIFANTAVSPDGTTNADTLSFGANADSRAFRSVSFSSGTWTFSVYAKSSTGKKFRFRISDASGTQYSSDQTTTSAWQRFSYQFTGAPTAIALTNEAAATAGSIDVYGFQGELGAYPTSLIPTTTAAVTRLADAAEKLSVSSLIGQTAGTLYAEVNSFGKAENANRIFGVSNGTVADRVIMLTRSTGFRFIVSNGGTNTADFTYTVNTDGVHKLAITYSASGASFFVDGQKVGTDSSITLPSSLTDVYVGCQEVAGTYSNNFGGSVAQALLFKSVLTDSQAIELTTI
jgi:hypothetical protein